MQVRSIQRRGLLGQWFYIQYFGYILPYMSVLTIPSVLGGGVEFHWTQFNYLGPTPGLWFRQDNWELIGTYLLGVCSHNNDSLEVAQLQWHLRKKKA